MFHRPSVPRMRHRWRVTSMVIELTSGSGETTNWFEAELKLHRSPVKKEGYFQSSSSAGFRGKMGT